MNKEQVVALMEEAKGNHDKIYQEYLANEASIKQLRDRNALLEIHAAEVKGRYGVLEQLFQAEEEAHIDKEDSSADAVVEVVAENSQVLAQQVETLQE